MRWYSCPVLSCPAMALVALMLGASLCRADDTIEKLTFMTEDYPPFNYVQDDKLKGFSVDLLELILKKLGSKKTRKDIQVHPWARSYRLTLKTPNTVLFVMTRRGPRENLFKWVGPVAASPIVLLAKKERNLKVRSSEEVKQFHIASVREDIAEIVLDEYGVPPEKREPVPYPELAAKMLEADRVDMWAYGDIAAYWIIKQNGFNPSEYAPVYDFGSAGDNYYAFNIDTPDWIIERFQNALDELKTEMEANGQTVYQNIIDRYIK
ncbi:transporter substrate-binding domain-containing protein [Hahella sp. KA22]|uniref:substrate-binding periplasmic protein n=1 Tax=Hahella sp. KA22 TaxID=1628392 RepID=UPI000FDE4E38|nr:ABC transporter substrate-binding protein [Hahella sp. KA22]AZZ91955.1 ABC transporter substrate-binding protein [Hahella sp. KA22]QAY55326.1 transporter substrate-binding domain-containing protein [Hahella sp. KA22]